MFMVILQHSGLGMDPKPCFLAYPPYGSSTSESVTLLNCREYVFFFDGSSLYSNETSAEPYKMPAWPKSHEEEGEEG